MRNNVSKYLNCSHLNLEAFLCFQYYLYFLVILLCLIQDWCFNLICTLTYLTRKQCFGFDAGRFWVSKCVVLLQIDSTEGRRRSRKQIFSSAFSSRPWVETECGNSAVVTELSCRCLINGTLGNGRLSVSWKSLVCEMLLSLGLVPW